MLAVGEAPNLIAGRQLAEVLRLVQPRGAARVGLAAHVGAAARRARAACTARRGGWRAWNTNILLVTLESLNFYW